MKPVSCGKTTSINGKRRRIGDDVVYFFIYLCAALSVVPFAESSYMYCQGNRPGKLAVSDQRDICIKRHCRNSGQPAQYTLHHNYQHVYSKFCRSGAAVYLNEYAKLQARIHNRVWLQRHLQEYRSIIWPSE